MYVTDDRPYMYAVPIWTVPNIENLNAWIAQN